MRKNKEQEDFLNTHVYDSLEVDPYYENQDRLDWLEKKIKELNRFARELFSTSRSRDFEKLFHSKNMDLQDFIREHAWVEFDEPEETPLSLKIEYFVITIETLEFAILRRVGLEFPESRYAKAR